MEIRRAQGPFVVHSLYARKQAAGRAVYGISPHRRELVGEQVYRSGDTRDHTLAAELGRLHSLQGFGGEGGRSGGRCYQTVETRVAGPAGPG